MVACCGNGIVEPGEDCASCPEDALPADINSDSSVSFDDLLLLLAAWGPCPACTADIDGDGDVGFSDLLALLDAWGPC